METNQHLYTAGITIYVNNGCVKITNNIIFSDTVSRSCVFCAIVTTINRCNAEGVIDIFRVVKELRIQKPEGVPTLVKINQSKV